MQKVIWTSIGVGGATILGSIVGFLFRKTICKHDKTVISFSAGLMLVAAVLGLIVPALDYGGLFVCVAGIFVGAFILWICDNADFLLRKNVKVKTDKGFLLFLAIAIHNLPEGMAAGVGFGGGEVSKAVTVATEIALQNIPEGMVIIGPMLASGKGMKRTFWMALVTAIIEIFGVFFGYFAVGAAYAILPFTLAFAAGMMLYVIDKEMIPDSRNKSFSFLCGFTFMLFFDNIL